MTSVEPNCSAWSYQWSPWTMPGGQMVNGASTYAQSVGEKVNKNERIGLASDEHSEASSSTSNNSDDCGESMNGSPLIALGSSSPSKKRRWEESEEALAAIALLAVFHDSINNSNSSSMMDAKKSRRGRPPKGSAAATCAAAALMEEEEGEEEEEDVVLEEDLEDEFEEEYEEEGSHSSSSSDGDTVPRYNKVKGENDPSYRASVGKKGSRKNSNGESNAERRARGGKTNRTATQRWTQDEHRLFRMGLARYGKGNWRRISSELLPHRTPAQVGSHAQKYFRYLERKDNMSVKDSKRWSIFSVKYSEEELLNGRM